MYSAVIAVLICFCALIAHAQPYVIHGTTRLPDNTPIYLIKDFPGEKTRIDSTSAVKGHFSFQKKIDLYPYKYYLAVNDAGRIFYHFIWDGAINVFLDSIRGNNFSHAANSPLTALDEKYFRLYFGKINDSIIGLSKQLSTFDNAKEPQRVEEIYRQQQALMNEEVQLSKKHIEAHPASFISLEYLRWMWGFLDYSEKLVWFHKIHWAKIDHPYKQVFETWLGNDGKTKPGNRIDFALHTATNIPVSLDSFKGTYVLLDFWASWCGPCIRSIPELQRIYNKYHHGKPLNVVSVSVENDSAGMAAAGRLVSKYNMNWYTVIEKKNDLKKILADYNIMAFPTQILLDKNGKIVLYLTGSTDNNLKKLESTIEKMN